MFGLPDCSRKDCSWPALCRVKVVDNVGETWVDLCVICVLSFPAAMREMNQLRQDQLRLEQEEEETDEPKLTEGTIK